LWIAPNGHDVVRLFIVAAPRETVAAALRALRPLLTGDPDHGLV
jgi:hypothetical protein